MRDKIRTTNQISSAHRLQNTRCELAAYKKIKQHSHRHPVTDLQIVFSCTLKECCKLFYRFLLHICFNGQKEDILK